MYTHLYRIAFLCMMILSSCNFHQDNVDADSITDISTTEIEEIEFSSPQELIKYVSSTENGYYKEKEIEEIKYSALLKPIDYIRATEKLKANPEEVADDDDLQYFDFRITVKNFNMEFLKYNLSEPNEYAHRISYCAYDMNKDIFLIDGKDTLPCVFYHFERAFDITPFGHFILAFKPTNKKSVRAKTLIYYDNLFNKGIIKMTFLPDDLIKVPKLIAT
jgi:hypothetical protein